MDPCVLQQQGKNTEIPRDVTGRERERVNAYTKRAAPLNISLRLIFRGIANHQKKTAHIPSFPSSFADMTTGV